MESILTLWFRSIHFLRVLDSTSELVQGWKIGCISDAYYWKGLVMNLRSTFLSAALLTAFLAGSAVAAQQSTSAPPAGHSVPVPEAVGWTPAYLVTDIRSVETPDQNVASIIKITNTSGKTCNYRVDFFYGHSSSPSTSVEGLSNPNLNTWVYCSRSVPDASGANIAACDNADALTYSDGKALIYWSGNRRCNRMGIQAYLIHTNSNDTWSYSARQANIVRWADTAAPKSSIGD
jgi:hypothetical protein